jgi:hypothetical protein
MDVPVLIEPDQPDGFEIDWDGVPGIEERVAAGDPALADPAGARRRVFDALEAAGLTGPAGGDLPQGVAQVVDAGEAARAQATPDRSEEALERAAREPAPPGSRRAVVRIATCTATVADGQDAGMSWRRAWGKRKAVLSVTIPGRPPYAVLDPELDIPRTRGDVSGAGIPALVSIEDPSAVEVLWGELAPVMDQVSQRVSDAMQGVGAQIQAEQAAQQQMLQASGIQQQMADSAQRVLQAITDPAQRQAMIAQYRAAGVEIDEDELAP